jgi:hypothetical protein
MTNPEPVPYASQLAVLPFIATIAAFIRERDGGQFRTTVHRIATQGGSAYFQQLCAYLGNHKDHEDQTKAGRLLPVTEGIIGYCYEHKKLARTKHFSSEREFLDARKVDMDRNKESGDVSIASYLAIPFIGREGELALVLYAECNRFNFFANDEIVKTINTMCTAYAALLDWLCESDALPSFQNFPLEPGTPLKRKPTVYRSVQQLMDLHAPTFRKLAAFNFEYVVP